MKILEEIVFSLFSRSSPANDNLMELLLCIDALKDPQLKILQLSFLILVMLGKTERLYLEHLFQLNLFQI